MKTTHKLRIRLSGFSHWALTASVYAEEAAQSIAGYR